ncbi:MAG: thioredoxin family protein [Akkermansia sp.]|nr:thioredoxin family protein [Akkermansia sp.]
MSILRTLATSVLLCCGMSQAQFDMMGFGTPSTMNVSPASSVQNYQPGQPFYLALKASFTAPWHAYWRNPGTVGESMTAELTAPAGFEVKGPYWQVPHKHEGVLGVAYTYENATVVWEVTPAADAPANAAFTLTATAQTCSDEGCNPPETQSTTVELSAGDGATNPAWGGEEKKVEILGDTAATITATQQGNTVSLSFIADPGLESAYFFSSDNSISPTAAQTLTANSDGSYTLALTRNDNSDGMYPVKDETLVGKPLSKLEGVLVYGDKHSSVNTGLGAAPAPAPAQSAGVPDGIAALCLSLFLGGLILNLMPCVFPVIGLKVMSFVQMGGGSRRKVFTHSMAFVLGVLVSFWIISVLMIVFSNLGTLAEVPWTQWFATLWNDAGSATRSWAVWMTNPWIVYCIMLLLLVLGLSMYGVFEIGAGITGAGQGVQSKEGLTGSFFQGFFVTVVATPCSAPFLGAAMPAAMALPGVWMTVALTFMALGLSFPYIVLGLFPSLVRLLPQPGEWMESLKQGLSFLLFAAAAWMLDVYLAFWPESESGATMWVNMSLVVFCAAFWVYGRWCLPFRPLGTRIAGYVVAIALAVLGFWGAQPYEEDSSRPEWIEWSPEAMKEALEEDESPVFVDYTAKWCATCQMNKKVAYTDEVYAAMSEAGVVLMRADKTSPNEEIDAAMRQLNRSSVPVNALYVPGKEPVVTSELLTPDYLLDFLKENLPAAEEEEE